MVRSMAQHLTYEYAALPARSIRLLRLHAGAPGAALMCSLHSKSLDDSDIEYNALSYCWGDESPPSPLLVVGNDNETKHIPIRPNLAAALSQLRTNTVTCCDLTCACQTGDNNQDTHPTDEFQFTSPVNLWIDAVCIDQSNLDERSRQVSLMDEIYTKATTVIAWLGPSNEYTSHALRMVHGFADLAKYLPSIPSSEISTDYDQSSKGNDGGAYITSARQHIATNPAFTPFWIALGHFFADNDWWERMWIVQEIALARRIIMATGPFGTTWTRFVQASEMFYQDNFYEQLCEGTLTTGEFAHIWPAIAGFQRVRGLERIRSVVTDSGAVTTTRARIAALDLSVMTLLGWSFRYKATNPRDKVYGIFGILKRLGATLPMQPRDDMSVCEVYMRASTLIYDQTGDLSFLESVENNRVVDYVRRFGLPSWTPDFAAPNRLLPISWARLADTAVQYRESWAQHWAGGEEHRCVFDLVEKTITVKGFWVDKIQEISDNIDDAISGTSTTKPEGALPVYRDRLDRVASGKEGVSEVEKRWGSVLGRAPEESWTWVPTREGVAANDDRGPGNRLFRTQRHSFVGFTQVAACAGDEVCWLVGLGFPCILRRAGRMWRFVGLCLGSTGGHSRSIPTIGRLKNAAVTMPGLFVCEEFTIC